MKESQKNRGERMKKKGYKTEKEKTRKKNTRSFFPYKSLPFVDY
jgi:hypothetical protein